MIEWIYFEHDGHDYRMQFGPNGNNTAVVIQKMGWQDIRIASNLDTARKRGNQDDPLLEKANDIITQMKETPL